MSNHIDTPEYAIYLPGRLELRIVNSILSLPEGETFKIIIHRSTRISADEAEAMGKMFRAITGDYIRIIRQNALTIQED